MSKKWLKKAGIFLAILCATPIAQYAGAGKSFGLFAGGAVVGGLVGSAIAKRHRSSSRPVYKDRVIERQPIYIQQVPQQATVSSTQQRQALQAQIAHQQQEINELKQALNRQPTRVKRPITRKKYSKVVFDDFGPALES